MASPWLVTAPVCLCLQAYWLSLMELTVSRETRACFKTTSCRRGRSVRGWCSVLRPRPPALAAWRSNRHRRWRGYDQGSSTFQKDLRDVYSYTLQLPSEALLSLFHRHFYFLFPALPLQWRAKQMTKTVFYVTWLEMYNATFPTRSPAMQGEFAFPLHFSCTKLHPRRTTSSAVPRVF